MTFKKYQHMGYALGLGALALFLGSEAYGSSLSQSVASAENFAIGTVGKFAAAFAAVWITVSKVMEGNFKGFLMGMAVLLIGAMIIGLVSTSGFNFAKL